MKVQVDLVKEVVLLIGSDFNICDAFAVQGKVEHEAPEGSVYYTYRSHLVAEGACLLCGVGPQELEKPCTSRQGFHAFVGAGPEVPALHRAEAWDLPVIRLAYEELNFFLERDHLFPVEEILPHWSV